MDGPCVLDLLLLKFLVICNDKTNNIFPIDLRLWHDAVGNLSACIFFQCWWLIGNTILTQQFVEHVRQHIGDTSGIICISPGNQCLVVVIVGGYGEVTRVRRASFKARMLGRSLSAARISSQVFRSPPFRKHSGTRAGRIGVTTRPEKLATGVLPLMMYPDCMRTPPLGTIYSAMPGGSGQPVRPAGIRNPQRRMDARGLSGQLSCFSAASSGRSYRTFRWKMIRLISEQRRGCWRSFTTGHSSSRIACPFAATSNSQALK